PRQRPRPRDRAGLCRGERRPGVARAPSAVRGRRDLRARTAGDRSGSRPEQIFSRARLILGGGLGARGLGVWGGFRARFFSRRALDRGRRRLRRTRNRLIGLQRMVLVPLLEPEYTRHALDLACRLAAERGSRVLLLAPLYVEWELPLDAHFKQEEAAL